MKKKLNWSAAWGFITSAVLVTAAEIEDKYDDSNTTKFQPELVVLTWMSAVGVLTGTVSRKQAEEASNTNQPK